MIHCDEGFICAGEIILSSKWVTASSDETLLAAVRRMTALSEHPYLQHTSPGISDSFSSIDEFLSSYQHSLVSSASAARKLALLPVRRQEFSRLRADRELALIERDGYACAVSGCNVIAELTIDHVIPLSKGGTDDLSNLSFLCRSHNSAKGDR